MKEKIELIRKGCGIMSAKEMFEELGYEKEQCTANSIEYFIWNKDLNIDIHITFDYDTKTFAKEEYRMNYLPITIQEFKAIQKQIEELWGDEL